MFFTESHFGINEKNVVIRSRSVNGLKIFFFIANTSLSKTKEKTHVKTYAPACLCNKNNIGEIIVCFIDVLQGTVRNRSIFEKHANALNLCRNSIKRNSVIIKP